MTLKEALINRGDDEETAEEIIQSMVESVYQGEDPEEVLLDEGLEPDYVQDLLELCL